MGMIFAKTIHLSIAWSRAFHVLRILRRRVVLCAVLNHDAGPPSMEQRRAGRGGHARTPRLLSLGGRKRQRDARAKPPGHGR